MKQLRTFETGPGGVAVAGLASLAGWLAQKLSFTGSELGVDLFTLASLSAILQALSWSAKSGTTC